MTRRKLVAGNWKMNGSEERLGEIGAIPIPAGGAVDVALAVPFTLIHAAAAASGVTIGAQDVHASDTGAHTGCVSAAMIREAGAAFAIVGHSERRADQCETDAGVKAKAEALHRHGLGAILCVGESEVVRDAGDAERVVSEQLAASLPEGAAGDWLSIAYEPIWAIGTGKTATPADVAAMHGALRAKLWALIGEEAETIRLLYGGSVNGDNAATLLHTADVDGALVGGASLTAAKFAPIVEAAA